MTVALLVISDGRDEYLRRCLASTRGMLPPVDHFVHVDDREHRLGFAGAVQAGWARCLATGADWVIHVEQDFAFLRPVPLARIISVLESNPHLVQMALLRQPWNESERAAGGIIGQHPDSYAQRVDGDAAWLEHRRFVTTNPCVWPRWVLERGWPDGPESEGRFGIGLFAEDRGYRSGFWGRGEVWVHHMGDVRAGWGY